MQKLNSVTVKKNEMVLNFVSDLARQTVPVVIDLDNNIAVKIKESLDVLRLILLCQEGVIPAEFIALIGYESEFDFKEVDFAKEFIDHYTELENAIEVTHFSMHENETVCKIKARKKTGSTERFTLVQYNAISLYETENDKLDRCLFAFEIISQHARMQDVAQDVFKSFAVNVYTESDSISTTANNINIEYDVILNEEDLDVIN